VEGQRNLEPYGSAHDLPSYIEMRQMIASAKVLTIFVARGQRKELINLERQVKELLDLVDRFYDMLGDRHWLFTDHLPLTEVEALLASAPSDAEAEDGLIAVIAERLGSHHWQTGLLGHEALRARRHSLDRARQHYLAEEWDSCAVW
jgi:hypothetical protein